MLRIATYLALATVIVGSLAGIGCQRRVVSSIPKGQDIKALAERAEGMSIEELDKAIDDALLVADVLTEVRHRKIVARRVAWVQGLAVTLVVLGVLAGIGAAIFPPKKTLITISVCLLGGAAVCFFAAKEIVPRLEGIGGIIAVAIFLGLIGWGVWAVWRHWAAIKKGFKVSSRAADELGDRVSALGKRVAVAAGETAEFARAKQDAFLKQLDKVPGLTRKQLKALRDTIARS